MACASPYATFVQGVVCPRQQLNSTRDGSALAWEGYHAWADLAAHVGASEAEVARYVRSGFLALAHEGNSHWAVQRDLSDALGIPWEWWTAETLRERLPFCDLARHGPSKRLDQNGFGEPTAGVLESGVFWPDAGYVADPMRAAQNLWDAAERHGARAVRGEMTGFRSDNRIRAVVLADGSEIAAEVVVNAAGPASARINGMAGVIGDTLAAQQDEQAPVAEPPALVGQITQPTAQNRVRGMPRSITDRR